MTSFVHDPTDRSASASDQTSGKKKSDKVGNPHVIVTPSIIAARDASYEHGVWLLGQASWNIREGRLHKILF